MLRRFDITQLYRLFGREILTSFGAQRLHFRQAGPQHRHATLIAFYSFHLLPLLSVSLIISPYGAAAALDAARACRRRRQAASAAPGRRAFDFDSLT